MKRTARSIIMTRTLVILALVGCVWAASDLKESRAGIEGDKLARAVLDEVVSGVRGVGSIARMVSALSSAVEILMFVLLKNMVDLTIPNQIFNLIQVGIYLVMPTF